MKYKVNPKDSNAEDTEVQAALVVIISHVLVPFMVKSIAYASDQLLNWFLVNESDGDIAAVDTSIFDDILVSSTDSSVAVDSY